MSQSGCQTLCPTDISFTGFAISAIRRVLVSIFFFKLRTRWRRFLPLKWKSLKLFTVMCQSHEKGSPVHETEVDIGLGRDTRDAKREPACLLMWPVEPRPYTMHHFLPWARGLGVHHLHWKDTGFLPSALTHLSLRGTPWVRHRNYYNFHVGIELPETVHWRLIYRHTN